MLVTCNYTITPGKYRDVTSAEGNGRMLVNNNNKAKKIIIIIIIIEIKIANNNDVLFNNNNNNNNNNNISAGYLKFSLPLVNSRRSSTH